MDLFLSSFMALRNSDFTCESNGNNIDNNNSR